MKFFLTLLLAVFVQGPLARYHENLEDLHPFNVISGFIRVVRALPHRFIVSFYSRTFHFPPNKTKAVAQFVCSIIILILYRGSNLDDTKENLEALVTIVATNQ